MQDMRNFSYLHLPSHLQAVSKQYHDWAEIIFNSYTPSWERDMALQKLLEAKDAIVRLKAMYG
jgi:hypothetical protein